MPKSGYFISYYTNETDVTIYLDNIVLSHRSGPLLQESDTYAFGGGIDALEIRSFGRAENKYGYNGKEKQSDLGLEWLDYGARMYDAQVGRWGVIDNLSENYASASPFCYAANSPIVLKDPDGNQIEIYWTEVRKDNNGKEYTYYGTYVYGSNEKAPSNAGVQNTIKALDYIVKNGLGVIEGTSINLVDELIKSKDVVGVQTTEKLGESRSSLDNYGFITFNPLEGLVTKNGKQNPSIGLLHELGHAWGALFDKANQKTRQRTPDYEGYDNAEEKFVITKIENPAAKKMKQGTRDGHGLDAGAPYLTTGPTSTTPAITPKAKPIITPKKQPKR